MVWLSLRTLGMLWAIVPESEAKYFLVDAQRYGASICLLETNY